MGWGPEETVVLHAGNMGAKQALENVVEAARLSDESENPVRFVMLGDGNQRSEIEARARGIKSIEFIDPLPDGEFEQVLSSADILLVNEKPGIAEMAVPSKLTTYYSTGLPVIAATDEGSVTAGEIQASGGGVRVDAGDPRALLDAVLSLRADPLSAGQLGQAGRDFRSTHLDRDAAIDHYAEWLETVAATRGRRRPVAP